MTCTRGKFIVIEGIDGSGKTTIIDKLANRMEYLEIPYVSTREASDGPIGRLLRSEFLFGKRKTDERVINLLYPADRLDHITNEEDGILKHLNEGYHVICDRYYMSTVAYDSYRHYGTPLYYGTMVDVLNRNKVCRELLEPDITFFLRVSPEVAMDRINTNRSSDEVSVYETADKLKKIAACYEDLIEHLRGEGQNIFCIDGTLHPDDILPIIAENLTGIIPGMYNSWKLPEEWMIGK